MKRIRIKSEDFDNISFSRIIKEKNTALPYLEESYEILLKYGERNSEYFISLNAKKENAIVNFTFEKCMTYEDFKELELDPLLLNIYNTTEKLFSFIVDAINEKKMKIKNVDFTSLTLLITSKILGISEPLKMELNLKRKDCDIYDTVKMLCDKVNQLEKENKLIKFKLENKIFNNEDDIKFIQNRLFQIPEFMNKKLSFKLIFRLTEDGTNSSDFRRKCNNIPNNLTLVKTAEGQRFGGFTQQSWTSSGNYKKDDNAFCFSLTKKKIYNIMRGYNAIGDYSNSGPVFLDNIFYIGYNGSLHNGNCNKNSRSNYSGERNNYEISGGYQSFTVREFEFYEILYQ
eukprot:jgi/Orpsp1_1/1188030/evm.model.d7180000061969.2